MTLPATSDSGRRTVLFVSYYFPPLGGGGVQRSLAYVRHLPSFGYDPVVVTRGDGPAVAWGPRDESLESRLSETPRVLRVRGAEPSRSGRWAGRRERWLRRPSPFARWWRNALVTDALEAARASDVLFATMSPFETAQAMAVLSRLSGRPWVADLRDPWALDDWLAYPSRLHRRLEFREMRRDLATAAAIIMNTAEATRALLEAAPELSQMTVTTIPNGFDRDDFSSIPPPRDPSTFTIVHSGHSHTEVESGAVRAARQVLGGSVRGRDTRTRSHLPLVRALELLFERRPDLREFVRVRLIGRIDDIERARLDPEIVGCEGKVTHGKAIDALRGGDLLFLPLHDIAGPTRTRIVPGKTYEYLAAGSPILAAVPPGDARDLLLAAGHADVCAPSDIEAIAHAIERRADDKRRGVPPEIPDADLVARFERRRLTADLAQTLDVVLGDSQTRWVVATSETSLSPIQDVAL